MVFRGQLTWAPLPSPSTSQMLCRDPVQMPYRPASPEGLSLRCSFFYDDALVFSKCYGFETLTLVPENIYLDYCDITAEIVVEFTPEVGLL